MRAELQPSTSKQREPSSLALRVAIAASVLWALLALTIAALRWHHPYELEWLEGSVSEHCARLTQGQGIYRAPTPEFVPLLYTPLYLYLGSWLSWVLGPGLPTLRLLSLAAAFACTILLYRWVRHTTQQRASAWLAVGIWCGSYFAVDTWWDCARIDSLHLALACSAWILLRKKHASMPWLAAMVMGAAYLTKQTALPLAIVFAASTAWQAPRRAMSFFATFAALVWLSLQLGDALSDGWFSFYTFTLPRDHELQWPFLLQALADLPAMLPILALGALHAAHLAHTRAWRTLVEQAILFGGMLAVGLLSRGHQGSAVNVLMPGWMALAMLVGTAWPALAACGQPWRGASLALILLQLASFAFDFGNADRPATPGLRRIAECVPSAADLAYGDRLVALLQSSPGNVMVPSHSYLARMAGKATSADAMIVSDVRGPHAVERAPTLLQDYLQRPWHHDAELLLLDDQDPFPRELPGFQPPERLLPADDLRTFVPRVGVTTRPIWLFRRVR